MMPRACFFGQSLIIRMALLRIGTVNDMNELIVMDGPGGELTAESPSAVTVNPAAIYLASLAPGSRPTMRRALEVIAGILTRTDAADPDAIPWQMVRREHVAAVRSELASRYAFSTANRMLSALRGVLRECWRLRQMDGEAFHRAADVAPVKGERVIAGRAVPSGELAAILNTCGQDTAGIRDAAIIALLYAGGLRRAELVGLDLADLERVEGGGRLAVKGKGNKERVVPLAGGAARALDDWLLVRGDAAGPLFQGAGNRQRGGRLTTQAVYAMLRTRATAAGVPALSPHDLRRTFVGDLLDAGADIATVQKLAGHASPLTTARYDRRDERAKAAAVERLHVPYTRRSLNVK